MKDFTHQSYRLLLTKLIEYGYTILSYRDYLEQKDGPERLVILRHDIDRDPKGALQMAKIETDLGIVASYYFRIVPEAFDPDVIKKIVALGHELGYHYEDLTLTEGDKEEALASFREHLEQLRAFYPVVTCCMHGSPRSPWDNRDMWKKKQPEYRVMGILAEPYFDLDFDRFFYLTDAGRGWNNEKTNRRDWVGRKFDLDVSTIHKSIRLIETNRMPEKLMLNIHPHNWSGCLLKWYKILIWQSFKNMIKNIVAKKQNQSGE